MGGTGCVYMQDWQGSNLGGLTSLFCLSCFVFDRASWYTSLFLQFQDNFIIMWHASRTSPQASKVKTSPSKTKEYCVSAKLTQWESSGGRLHKYDFHRCSTWLHMYTMYVSLPSLPLVIIDSSNHFTKVCEPPWLGLLHKCTVASCRPYQPLKKNSESRTSASEDLLMHFRVTSRNWRTQGVQL